MTAQDYRNMITADLDQLVQRGDTQAEAELQRRQTLRTILGLGEAAAAYASALTRDHNPEHAPATAAAAEATLDSISTGLVEGVLSDLPESEAASKLFQRGLDGIALAKGALHELCELFDEQGNNLPHRPKG